MTAEQFTTVKPEIPRDRYQRPLVIPRGGGKPVAFTRATTFVGCLEDTYNLAQWQQRMVAVGLAQRPDLLVAAAAHRDDKNRLNEIVDAAREAAAASAAATTGTALHSLTEQYDRGTVLPTTLPADVRADLNAYAAAMAPLEIVGIEEFVVCDEFKVGGTFDRLVLVDGQDTVFDIKTGRVDYGIGKIAMQLAMYAHSERYDPATGARTDLGARHDFGVVIHLPAGEARCELIKVDLAAGWEAVQLAAQVRAWRTRATYKNIASPFTATGARASTLAPPPSPVDPIHQAINDATSVDDLVGVWQFYADTWTPEHTTHAALRRADLAAATTRLAA
jgi:hypothetical protein